MAQNPHWQQLIDAQRTGARITIQQHCGDPLVNVKVLSTENGIILEDEDGHTVTIELSDVRGVPSKEIVEDKPEIYEPKTNWETLVYYGDKITAITLRTGGCFFVESIQLIDPGSQNVMFIDTNERLRDFQVKSIAKIRVEIDM